MINVVKFKKEHYFQIEDAGSTCALRAHHKVENLQAIEDATFSYTYFWNERPVMCGGFHEYWHGRAEAWVIFSDNVTSVFTPIFKNIKKMLDESSIERIEATVDCNAINAHRLVTSLGFRLEAPKMRKYHPTGGDCSLYARVRN